MHVSLYAKENGILQRRIDGPCGRSRLPSIAHIQTIEHVFARWEIEKSGAHKIMIMGEASHIASVYEELEKDFSDDVHFTVQRILP